MKFNQIRVGMEFEIFNYNYKKWVKCKVTNKVRKKGFVTLKFDDNTDTYTWGLPKSPLPSFIREI